MFSLTWLGCCSLWIVAVYSDLTVGHLYFVVVHSDLTNNYINSDLTAGHSDFIVVHSETDFTVV